MKVLVCGGGALAHVLGGVLGALPDVQVTIFTRRQDEWSRRVTVLYEEVAVIGNVRATNDPSAAHEAEFVFVAAPAFAHEPILLQLLPYLSERAWIAALPAIGGFDILVRDLLPNHSNILGSLRSPYNARVACYGEQVQVYGIVPCLDIVLGPASDRIQGSALLKHLLGIPLRLVEPFAAATLSPGGTIFHPARMFELMLQATLHEQDFYAGWGPVASLTYLAMDAELAMVRRALNCDVAGLEAHSHYGVSEPDALTARIRSLRGLPAVPSPIRGDKIDVAHRFVSEDVPYGLRVARQGAAAASLQCPTIDKVEWTISAAVAAVGGTLPMPVRDLWGGGD